MKIFSANKMSWLGISAKSDGLEYSCFEIEVMNNPSTSCSFHAKHSDMQLQGIIRFTETLDRFITDRSITPKLEGTYDSHLIFRATGSHVMLEFLIGNRVSGDPTPYRINGAFEIDQSYLNEYAADFRNLAPCA